MQEKDTRVLAIFCSKTFQVENTNKLKNAADFILMTKKIQYLPHPKAPRVCSESVLGSQYLDP